MHLLSSNETVNPEVPQAVTDLCHALRSRGWEAFVVGGAVRDILLKRVPHDWDVATNATPTQVQQTFGSTFAIPTGLQHGTVTVLAGNDKLPVEVTTYRTEGVYSDGRRPDEIRFARTIYEDLSRRDFTMNAIALEPIRNVLIDPFDGKYDLKHKIVRAVGEPKDRFVEDGLRSMRAIRQACQLGFVIEPATYNAIRSPESIATFKKISIERVRDELLKMLATEQSAASIETLQDVGLLSCFLPEISAGIGLSQNKYHVFDVFRHTTATVGATFTSNPIWKLGALLHDVGKPVVRAPKEGAEGEFSFHNHEHIGAEMAHEIVHRLKLPTDDQEIIVGMVEHHMYDFKSDWSDSTVRRFVRRVGRELLPALFALRIGDRFGKGRGENAGPEIEELKRRIEVAVQPDTALSVKDLAVSGDDVIEVLKCKPSKIVGDTLKKLLEHVTENPKDNNRETLLGLIGSVF